jgi:hypothetical protein
MSQKSTLLVIFVLLISQKSFSQIGITFHQSNIPSIGINKQIGERLLPEFRIGTDNFFEDTGLELDINYLLIKRKDFQFYSGLGGRIQIFEGLVIPVGVNIYPLENKNFGFHIELAGIVGGNNNILRGSWGIRIKLE